MKRECIIIIRRGHLGVFMKKLITVALTLCLLGGETTATADTTALLAACTNCHGEKGISTVQEIPNLAAQHVPYLIRQMHDYQAGKRKNPVMQQVLVNLNNDDILYLADYFSKFPAAKGTTLQKYLLKGESIYRGGIIQKGVPACIACHGPQGKGNAFANFPYIAGQHAAYAVTQLKAFQNGTRVDTLHIMPGVAHGMDESEMAAVASYAEGLH